MKPAEKNYPIQEKEFLPMRYALIKFRVYLLDVRCIHGPHFSSDRNEEPASVAANVSFFAKYNFVPGKNNILVDALSRRPDYDPRRDVSRQDSDDDDEDDCACCIALGLNAPVSAQVSLLRQQIAETY
ncbi:LOW QUALITY PROTEIN: hypothetical protein PHMEG_0008838 [Phytophthora megakarya]|uniref:Reverse transcriptase RNase H-like domain-containing protein n=1 Tax=Phytophthora megakarya TaxID=4795 RepID=A0A225WJ22_9STRA|nr:LOW QUALITY PROTEIN: hypothetical protein PHMEG_0008838 [Phytophthora megakarya]